MINTFNILVAINLSLIFLNVSFTNEIKHDIKVIHKGVSLTEPIECTLVEIQNENGKPQEFYMDVESVVCGDKQCRIDIVRIYWNKLGQYSRLELPDNVELEKEEGEHFSSSDYNKLNIILNDENSPLKDVYKSEIVSTVGSEGVDAMTGATVLVEKSAYVQGAVWTCYSLWHWVHGETKQIIREITGRSYSISELQSSLQGSYYQYFAIEQLIIKKDFSEKTVDAILKVIDVNPMLLKSSLPYWEITPNEIYINTMQRLILSANTNNRLLCFNAILQTKQNLPPDFFKKLNVIIPKLTYQEIDLFLRIVIAKDGITPEVISQLLPLLDNENFLIARRVYWFLNQQELSDFQKSQINVFYQKWKNRL
ncbi:hypothetical protein [Aquimarina sp. RZ0]|uniref:hypothetical protein n=1 Tax=Aquimarina sp. RZ0 TaxID=2607730 RepID=UPI0011F24C09|nr:hypothetical protein [Aquimarina sp. RZ0]KAA1242872.1 hypothetical protein F0000_23540 [Aquimarina sp. RZ0]